MAASSTYDEEEAKRAAAAAAAREAAHAAGFPALLEQPIGAGRRVRVVAIGAGFSGVGAAIHLREHVKDVDIQIYEKSDDVGGTWHLNRYAGVACDIPAHTYQFSFADYTQWSRFFAPGAEIQQYIKRVVDHFGVRPLIKFECEVVEARWIEEKGQWHLKIRKGEEEFEDYADFLSYSPGLLGIPAWPKIPGRETYKGIVRHSARWDTLKEEKNGMDWSNMRVGVIGVGSSAIQIVPEMQKRCKEVVNFGRSKTWLATVFSPEILAQLGVNNKTGDNHLFTDTEKEKLKDSQFYRDFRLMIERDLGSVHYLTHRNSDLQNAVHEHVEAIMRQKLATKPEIAAAIIPDFPLGCKRLTPGPGYLDALTKENVQFVTDDLECFTEKGIRTKAGEEFELDAIICATGFDTSSVPPFPVYGKDGINLQDMRRDNPGKTYMAVTVPNMPNFFSVLNTQSGVGSGNLLIVMEAQVAYMAKTISKCQREGYASFLIKEKAVNAFLRYVDDYFARTVFSDKCKSWYKGGKSDGPIRTLWPGSSQHAVLALKHPRWEDYDWTQREEYQDEMAWLGDGHIAAELDPAFYYDELRAMHSEVVQFDDKLEF